MSLLSKLFGGGSGAKAPEPQGEAYEGFMITPDPARVDGGFRLGATIEKGGQTHTMIRADIFNDHASAVAGSIAKAKMVIDQVGDDIFR